MDEYTPFTMVPPSDDIFLLMRKDRLEDQVVELRKQCKSLSQAKDKHRKLQRSVMEEKIARLVASKFTEEIKDPTKHKASDMKDFQQRIHDKMMATTEARCVQELIGYHRLGGRTRFKLQDQYEGIRIDTFYGRSYREPYYLLLQRDPIDKRKLTIQRHTIPQFIQLDRLADMFLLKDQETFLRILQDFLLAYVSRREQINEFVKWAEDQPHIKNIQSEFVAKTRLEFDIETDAGTLRVQLYYNDISTDYPKQARIKQLSESDIHDFTHEENTFCSHKIVDAFHTLFG